MWFESVRRRFDLVATVKGKQADQVTASLAFPTFNVSYTLEVAAELGGVRVSINLDQPLPEHSPAAPGST